jgi:transcription antitermination factor NusG
MNLKNIFIVLCIFLALSNCRSKDRNNIGVEIDLANALNLNALHKSIKLSMDENPSSLDKDGNIYYVDDGNHRIIKIKKNGTIIRQIGSIGQDNESLYQPTSIFIRDETLYILDHFGHFVKTFSTEGTFLSVFAIENCEHTTGIYVDDKYIYTNTIYNNKNNFKKNKLITILTKDGRPVNRIGDIIRTKDFPGYTFINRVFLTVVDKKIYVSFRFIPYVMGFDPDGNKILEIDLRKFNIHEIDKHVERAKQMNVDSEDTIEGPRVRLYHYCEGFIVDNYHHFYYSNRDCILHFDENFKFLGQVKVKQNIHIDGFFQLFTDQQGKRYAISSVYRQIHLIQF